MITKKHLLMRCFKGEPTGGFAPFLRCRAAWASAGSPIARRARRDAVGAAYFGVPLGCANEKSTSESRCFRGNRQRPILPGRVQPSTFGTGELNYCVRYGNRWDLSVITTGKGSSTRFDFPHFCFLSYEPGFNPCGLHPDNCTKSDSKC